MRSGDVDKAAWFLLQRDIVMRSYSKGGFAKGNRVTVFGDSDELGGVASQRGALAVKLPR